MEETIETPETTEIPETLETESNPLFTSDEIVKVVVVAALSAAVKLSIDAAVKHGVPKVKKALENRKAKKAEKDAAETTLVGVK